MASKKTRKPRAAPKPSKPPSQKATSRSKRPASPVPTPVPALATPEVTPGTDVASAAPLAATSAQPATPPPDSALPQTVAGLLPTEPKKLSAIDAAAKILAETGQALSCPELIALMAAKGYWTSPGGKTPASTLYASFLRELKT